MLRRLPLTVQRCEHGARDPRWRPARPDDLTTAPPASGVCYLDEAAREDVAPYYWLRDG